MYLKGNDVDQRILNILAPLDAHILVRLPPTDTVTLEHFRPQPHVTFYRPGVGFHEVRHSDREISRADDDHLINSLAYSSVVIATASTICIDAAVFDRPVVLIGFDAAQGVTYLKSAARFLESEHSQRLIRTGACLVATNGEELLRYARHCLAHPEQGRAGRERLIREQCLRLDGASSERVARILIASLHEYTTARN